MLAKAKPAPEDKVPRQFEDPKAAHTGRPVCSATRKFAALGDMQAGVSHDTGNPDSSQPEQDIDVLAVRGIERP